MSTHQAIVGPVHPSVAAWDEYIDQSPATRSTALTAHLESCAACQETMERLVALGDALRNDPPLVAPPSLKARILQSRADGVRTLIPDHEEVASADDEGRTSPREAEPSFRWVRRVVQMGIAAAVLLAVPLLTRRSQNAEAGMTSGQLTLIPALPTPGQRVHVQYRAGLHFGRPEVLRLRARLRQAGEPAYDNDAPVTTLAELTRTGGADYTGWFLFPERAVYGALAVEDTAALVVDDRGGRGWDVLAGTGTGQPLLQSLAAQQTDLVGRSWESGLEAARYMVALYPDSLLSWSTLQFYETFLGIESPQTIRVHRTQLVRFDSLTRAGHSVQDDRFGGLFWYATVLGDSARSQYWRRRLLAETPNTGFAVQERLGDVSAQLRLRKDRTAAQAEYEQLWRIAPPDRRDQVAGQAFGVLASTGAPDSVVRVWADRVAGGERTLEGARIRAQRLLRVAPLRNQARLLLDSLVTRSADPAEYVRRLDENRARFMSRIRDSQSDALVAYARVLLEDGRGDQGNTLLRRAVSLTWNTDAMALLGERALAQHDTAGALEWWAGVAVDPRVSAKRRQSVDSTARALRPVQWKADLSRAYDRLARSTMAAAESRSLRPIRLFDARGGVHPLDSLAAGKTTIVALWSMRGRPAVGMVRDLQRRLEAFEAHGIAVITVITDSHLAPNERSRLLEMGLTSPVFFDDRGDATRELNNWGTPGLFVIAPNGRVMFRRTNELGVLELQAQAVRQAFGK